MCFNEFLAALKGGTIRVQREAIRRGERRREGREATEETDERKGTEVAREESGVVVVLVVGEAGGLKEDNNSSSKASLLWVGVLHLENNVVCIIWNYHVFVYRVQLEFCGEDI